MNQVIIVFLILIAAFLSVYNIYNICTDKNSYLGVNTKCKYCMKNPGKHNHDLSTHSSPDFDNMDSSGVHCPYCMTHPDEFHIHHIK